MDEPYLSIIIPAYNEAQRIGKSLETIREYLARKPFAAELIVVDDGSIDGTPALLETFATAWPELRILRNEPNRGKGYSVRRGALEARAPYILFTDADLSTPIEEADRLLAAMESTEADAAIGSRALKRELIGIHQPKFREWAGILFTGAVRLLPGSPFTTPNADSSYSGAKRRDAPLNSRQFLDSGLILNFYSCFDAQAGESWKFQCVGTTTLPPR